MGLSGGACIFSVTHLDLGEQVEQVLHLVVLLWHVVLVRLIGLALGLAPVQGQLHGRRNELDAHVAHRLVHVAVQFVCDSETWQLIR